MSNPILLGISKMTLDKSLGLTKYEWGLNNKVHTKRSIMHFAQYKEVLW